MPYKTGAWGEQAKARSKIYVSPRAKLLPELPYLGRDTPIEFVVQIYQKAKGLCEKCGEKGQLMHHKDGIHDNHILENLQLLCRSCHQKHHHYAGIGDKNYNWKGDEATEHSKYYREWRKRKRQKQGENYE